MRDDNSLAEHAGAEALDAIRAAIEAAGGAGADIATAAAAVVRAALDAEPVRVRAAIRQDGMLAALVWEGAYARVYRHRSDIRDTIAEMAAASDVGAAGDPPARRAPPPSTAWAPPRAAVERIAAATRARLSLYDWPLPNSAKRLGDATAEDLREAAAWHGDREGAERARRLLYEALGRRLEAANARTVREGIAEDELAALLGGCAP